MPGSRIVQVVTLVLSVALVFAASRLMPSINQNRDELNLIGAESAVENTPPEYAFAVQAFGAFRGLLTNIAFMRAENYKEQGRYYDAVQLGMWICKLQPRFPSVWEFVSWNLAWNISVTTYTPEERWNWVYNGVKLLRDEGLRFNPRAFNLYKQIAWIYNNKMGEMVDDQHLSYKCNWAWRMHLVLGPPPAPVEAVKEAGEVEPLDLIDPRLIDKVQRMAATEDEYRRRKAAENNWEYVERKPPTEEELKKLATMSDSFEAQAAKRAAYEFLKQIEEAPTTLEALRARSPEAGRVVDALREIGVEISDATLAEDAYWNEGGLAWTFFQRYRSLKDPPSILRSLLARPVEEPTDPVRDRFAAIMGIADDNPAGLEVLRFMQKKVLTEVYRLDVREMMTVVAEFGAIDWRYVDAHSLYWVTISLLRGDEDFTNFQNDRINTARLLFFSLRNLFSRGNIVFEPDPKNVHLSYLDMTPNLNLAESMHLAYLRYGKMLDPQPEENDGVGYIFRVGHINFLTEAIRALYLRDREAEAMHFYRYLANTYGREPDGTLKREYQRSLHDYVMSNFYENLSGYREAQVNVGSLLRIAFEELSDGNVARYNKLTQRALDVWKTYMEDKNRDLTEKRKLPPFGEIQKDVLRVMLGIPSPNRNLLVRKAKLWRNVPVNLKRWVYDDLIGYLRDECTLFGFDVAKAFTEPPGMEEFRAEHPIRLKEQKEESAETTVQPTRR
jgi:hypothetical protein